ncbi:MULTISPECIES: Gfo/Idh/MocA family protein [Chelativorans]|jgi:predicted dehydrogenase|uniref:Oxidoreductase-like protein n=1 Tax=Chelativorans sp. (strain BNC1) TaxID=266779 RepID=Q11GX5_CHESB|nr:MULTISPECIES: Gfo/Idh/MocA family oxidoreductase [Chelativorans]
MMRVGIVGTAFGESRCRMLAAVPQAQLIAVCGRDEARTRAVAERHNCVPVLDYRALIARPDIDVVGVYTSTDMHGEIAIAALRAGKHVIVSKPTAVDVPEGEAMLAAAREAGVQLVVEFDTRYVPGAYRIYKAIAEGRLGPLIQGDYVNKCQRSQAYYDEGSGWRGIAAMGGGCLQNQGVHPIDHLLWYQGQVEGVFAFSATVGHDIPAEDAASAVIRFTNGSFATLTVTTTYRSNLPDGRYGGGTLKRAQVHGSLGSATIEGDTVADWVVPEAVVAAPIPDHPPLNVFQDLAWTLADSARPAHTLVAGERALDGVYITAALRQSAATGAYVAIDQLRGVQ